RLAAQRKKLRRPGLGLGVAYLQRISIPPLTSRDSVCRPRCECWCIRRETVHQRARKDLNMKRQSACNSQEHLISRRHFMGGRGGAGMGGGLGALALPAAAARLSKDQKRVLVIYMAGGLSQLESWDPKPKTDTGGPFRAIPTVVPGIHLSELLPLTARHM